MTQLTVEIIQEGGLQIVEVLHPGPRGAKGDPGETLVLTGPALAGRASGSGNLVAIPLAPGLAIVNGALTLTGVGSGTVTSVGLTVPNGFSVSNSPITGSGTLAVTFATGYSLPTTAKQGQWDQAYADLGQARTPSNHKASHATGGADALTPGDIGAAPASHSHTIASVSGLQLALDGKEPSGAAAAAIQGHEGAANPHNQYELKTSLGNAAYKNTGTTAGTVAAGDDARFAALEARLNAFRDAATVYVSKRITASDSNNGTSDGEPFLTIGAAVAAANAYVTANPGAFAKINIGPGRFVEASLPLRLKPQILVQGSMQRGTIMEPAAGQELNGFFALDSGCMVSDIRFAGHQATGTSDTDSSVGTRAWAIRFNEQANSGQGVYLTASPYVKDCASITAEDDSGLAGSTSTGDTGGGVEVDGAKCKADSPIRSMVVYGFTQQNLGGPGAIIKNDAYAELVSFFGLFGTWHVQTEAGGQATLSGGGCSEFGLYGLVADGYSSTPIFTGSLRVAALAGATAVEVVNLSANRLGTSSRPAAGQQMLLGGNRYVVQSAVPIDASGTPVADSAPTRAGYQVNFFNETGSGLVANVAQNATADFRQRSQISAGAHTALYVGSGRNYNALPNNGGVPIRANQIVQRNGGRVFCTLTNEVGDFEAGGGVFKVDGVTGNATLDGSQVDLANLNAVGPFSRNGGLSTVGVQLKEFSNNITLLNSLGIVGQDTAPTQYAVKGYIDPLLASLAPLNSPTFTGTVSGITPSMIGLGNVNNTSDQNKPISTAAAAALAGKVDTNDSRLTDAREWSASTISQADAEAGISSARRAFTAERVFQAIAAWWNASAFKTKLDGIASGATANSSDATLLNRANHTGTQPASTVTGLATVATSGAYNDLSGRPTLFNPAAPGAIGGTTAGTATFTRLGSKRQTVTAVSSTYTLDCSAFNEFVAAASIAGNTTISLTNLNTIPSDEVVRYVFRFTWASGAITLSAPAGYTFKRAGSTPGSAGDYQLLITAAGDSTVLLVSYGGAHT